jgi:uncharacterized membrane protein
MRRVIPYVVTLLVFLAMDAVWLTLTGGIYRDQLGALLAPQVRWEAAVCFYLLQILGIQIFVLPRAAKPATALAFGAGFGIFTYATYDLTNLSVLKYWTYSITAMDIVWGAIVTGTASLAGYFAVKFVEK